MSRKRPTRARPLAVLRSGNTIGGGAVSVLVLVLAGVAFCKIGVETVASGRPISGVLPALPAEEDALVAVCTPKSDEYEPPLAVEAFIVPPSGLNKLESKKKIPMTAANPLTARKAVKRTGELRRRIGNGVAGSVCTPLLSCCIAANCSAENVNERGNVGAGIECSSVTVTRKVLSSC